jgi:hypothetical protein
MPAFIGFNTQNQYKKFTLTDGPLVKRDLLNAFNIRQGQLPGRPQVGTSLWDNLFENQDSVTEQSILSEIQRVAGGAEAQRGLRVALTDTFIRSSACVVTPL